VEDETPFSYSPAGIWTQVVYIRSQARYRLGHIVAYLPPDSVPWHTDCYLDIAPWLLPKIAYPYTDCHLDSVPYLADSYLDSVPWHTDCYLDSVPGIIHLNPK